MGNFLVRDGQVIPIDFSFCGMGHYLFDLSVSLAGGLNAALRPVFLRGYRSVRALPAEALRPVDAYALAGRLSYYAYQIDNPAERTWLQRRIPEVAKTDCARFLQGERIMTIDD
jgi:Ser/Thr protein kinase RdoA (MazF antagonist)